MPFTYLQQPPFSGIPDDQDSERPTGGIQFHLPEYLFDAPPTLAPGGGAEAFHPAQGARWFANNGFQYPTNLQYQNPDNGLPAVQSAYDGLAALQEAFPAAISNSSGSNHNNFNTALDAPYHPQWLSVSAPLDQPSPLTAAAATFPLYSQSGFDVISLLSRVQNRPNPTVNLGPVDFTTSFVVVDVRRFDDPIVHCSPNFCALTQYSETEIIGRNCRFLQAPPAGVGAPPLGKGEQRKHTDSTAVGALAKSIVGRKETQQTLLNYRKDGSAFMNLLTIVPLFGEHVDDEGAECVWLVGFQVDVSEQSAGIVERMKEGKYYTGAVEAQQLQRVKPKAGENIPGTGTGQRERRMTTVPAPEMSTVLTRLLKNPKFLGSCGITQPPVPGAATQGLPPDPTSHAIHSLLLEQLPDFVHVLSLKGAFLYVAPSVTRVLGWEPAELVGRTLADLCFAADVVSVGRALKEASLPLDGTRSDAGEKDQESRGKEVTPPNVPTANSSTSTPALTPADLRIVDLVFRARTKQGSWVWVECRGRLHIEPGKGRKAIVLIGRARGMARVPLGTSLTGGVQVDAESSVSPAYSSASSFLVQSPTSSVSGLEFALQPKRARIEDVYTRAGSSSTMRTTTSPEAGLAGGTPTIFYGLMDPYGLLLSVGDSASSVVGWDPLDLRGTRLGSLVEPDHRLSPVGAPTPVDALLARCRANPERTSGPTEVRCMLRAHEGPVDVVVCVTTALPEPSDLPEAVAPARLMYSVRRTGTSGVPRGAGEDVYKRLDPMTGGSWQYELQQLRYANARLEEEIEELVRAEDKRAEEQEKERERVRGEQRVAYHQQQRQQVQLQAQMYGYDQQPQWGYAPPSLPYRLPMKRTWDTREDA
ncbi:white collar protein 1 [Favolaschia claudopus]|uniref:White collar protein 1 n=1 Tax=Favolaschia claudopus TaxID=2862362 RepID=A0AAW0DMK4_9AGAR